MNSALVQMRFPNQAETRAANIAAQRLIVASGGPLIPGICRFCGCTEAMPCTVQLEPPAYCAWWDPEQTVCSSPQCIDAFWKEEGED